MACCIAEAVQAAASERACLADQFAVERAEKRTAPALRLAQCVDRKAPAARPLPVADGAGFKGMEGEAV